MKKDQVKYREFYNGYSLYFKEGICTENDQNIKVGLDYGTSLFVLTVHVSFFYSILKVVVGSNVLEKRLTLNYVFFYRNVNLVCWC